LLVEDNEANIQTFMAYLSAYEYRVILAKNGEEGVAMAKEHQPDIILMDIQMPVMDGLQATRLIRSDPKLAKVPIVALTARAMQGDQERCIEAGANQYLSKPVELEELVGVITQFLLP
jgi:CheY-like chemotaxis protein